MDNSSLTGTFLSSMTSGFLDLEPSIQSHQQTHLCSGPHNHNRNMQPSMNMIAGLQNDDQPISSPQKSFSLNFGLVKGVASANVESHNNVSEDDEPSYTDDGTGENLCGAKGKNGSPWQRMKWTDNVVRLLIAVVAHVGDDSIFDDAEGLKRKSGPLQKKGKWKTISKIMISKGCHVSPQQCEDKFNDLNKRYKKLNDILGRGISCRVVEDPSRMDTMRHLSRKMKDDVKKILSSKHLFYREMCAYHNGQSIPNCSNIDLQVNSLPLDGYSKDSNDCEEEEGGQGEDIIMSEDDESDDEDHNIAGGDSERMQKYDARGKQHEEDGNLWSQPSVLVDFQAKITDLFEKSAKSQWERKQSLSKMMLHLQEQRVRIEAEAFELEKRSFKWRRFCTKKESELERLRLDNERMRLENERMLLQLKHKEMEIDSKVADASAELIPLSINKLQERNQIDLSSPM